MKSNDPAGRITEPDLSTRACRVEAGPGGYRPPAARIRASTLALMVTVFLAAPSVPALESDKDQPIHIEADSVDINDREGVSIYTGDVQMTQGSIHMTADKVTVYQKDNRTEKLVAVGRPVTFKQTPEGGKEDVKGRALRVDYFADSEEIVLIDEAQISQGDNTFSSDRIKYDRAKAVLKAGATAEGRKRVYVTIQPENQDSAPQ